MRTKRYWDNRYMDFCDKILGEEIRCNQLFMDAVMDEIVYIGEFFKESIEKDEAKAEEVVLFCYINHELNVLDPIGICYPQISNEYSSYAWGMVGALLQEGREQFPILLKERLRGMYDSVNSDLEGKVLKAACHKITTIMNGIYNSLEFVQNLHKEQFSESLFWKKQFAEFQYQVLGESRKEYASAIIFLQEERDSLLQHKDENMAGNYEDYVQFLYINHRLNRLDPTNMYYPQFHYQYEKYAWKILRAYKNCSESQFSIEINNVIVSLFEAEGCDWKQKQTSIQFCITEIHKRLASFNK